MAATVQGVETAFAEAHRLFSVGGGFGPRPVLTPHDVVLPAGGGVHPVMEDDRVVVEATRVFHGPEVADAYAYRFTVKRTGKVAVFSGDTAAPDANLIELARGCDVLVHEVQDNDDVQRIADSFPSPEQGAALKRHLLEAHSDVRDVPRVAHAAGAGRVVFSHYTPLPQSPAAYLEKAQAVADEIGYAGEIIAPAELDVVAALTSAVGTASVPRVAQLGEGDRALGGVDAEHPAGEGLGHLEAPVAAVELGQHDLPAVGPRRRGGPCRRPPRPARIRAAGGASPSAAPPRRRGTRPRQVCSRPASAARAVTVVSRRRPSASSANQCTSSCRAASPPRPAEASTRVGDRSRSCGAAGGRGTTGGDRRGRCPSPVIVSRPSCTDGDLGRGAADGQPARVVEERGSARSKTTSSSGVGTGVTRSACGQPSTQRTGARNVSRPSAENAEAEPDRPHAEQHHRGAAVRRLDEVGVPEVLHRVLRCRSR